MKKIILIIWGLIISLPIYATHNRAGEIVYKHLGGYRYEVTIYTYTFTGSLANRDSLELDWGDNTKSYILRHQRNILPDSYQQNIYSAVHTYPGVGTYILVMQDPNRNEDVKNIPNSVNVMFALKTILQINPLIGSNSTPILYNKPIDKATVNQIFKHNPAAYDPDGDSISYKMAECLQDKGLAINNFTLPMASKSITVDAISGDLIWETPIEIGIYNVAMEIEEWRKGIKISSIIRDIQIEVIETDNKPPYILEMSDLCVEADSLIKLLVTAKDPDNDYVYLGATGGVFDLPINHATFPSIDFPIRGLASVTDTFVWKTCCEHIQQRDYTVVFKAFDDNPEIKLTDYQNLNIKVVGPATKIIQLEPTNASILVKWQKNRCPNVVAYKLYRKNNLDDFTPAECQTGMPESLGYELIKTITDINETTFFDNNQGKGLTQGFIYCYRIVCEFTDGSEGYVSNRKCAKLEEGLPIMTQVTVKETDKEKGIIHLEWQKPNNLDIITIPGPYQYNLFYSQDLTGEFYTGPIIVDGLDNTTYNDTLINTKDSARIYKLSLLNKDLINNDWNTVGPPSIASSVFLYTYPGGQKATLKYEANVPWQNDSFVVYRQNPDTKIFDSIAWTKTNTFVDYNLTNGQEYCYKVKSIGHYTLDYLPNPIENFSQISCVIPKDVIPPCPISFDVKSQCAEEYNLITWQIIVDSCLYDTKKVLIYYSNQYNGEMKLLKEVEDPKDFMFKHYPELSLAGCYTITGIDEAGNEGTKPEKICVDNCTYYNLPNIFTPNQDNENDKYHPILPYKFVEKINLQIYNRWGTLVFTTEDPDIDWDGKDMTTGQKVSDGIYYYICDVYEQRLMGLQVRNITGFIHVYAEKTNRKN